jgi:hypothetical protein
MLSIKFVTDRYVMGGQQRGYGRVTGTIGPYLKGEPRTFVIGRHLAPPPKSKYAQADCCVDSDRRKVLVDVGNSLPIDAKTGDFLDGGVITLAAGSGAAATVLGSLDYTDAENYPKTAGIYELPAGRALTDAELAAVTSKPLQLLVQPKGAAAVVVGSESDDGVYVRAEDFVFRLDPGGGASTDLIATRFGTPFAGATPSADAQAFSLPDTSPLPTVTTDPKTDAGGRAKLTVTAVDPGRPRDFIDGQVYAITFSLKEPTTDPSTFDGGNFISLLMFSAMAAPASPGWSDVHPIFEQYAHLYPRPHGPNPYAPFSGLPPSHPVVNLDDYGSVAGFTRHIVWALDLPLDHPSHMPVTRDLSGAKRALLLKWLRALGPDGKPKQLGAPAVVAAMAPRAEAARPPPRFAARAFAVNPRLARHEPPGES